jgi:hypothetical protein
VFHLPGHPAGVRALVADGRYLTARPSGNGTADTYFSIPAYVQSRGRTVSGYLTPCEESETGYAFRAYLYGANHAAVAAEELDA